MAVRDDILSLLGELDGILAKRNRLFAGMEPSDRESLNDVLEKIRRYLVAQQQQALAASTTEPAATQQIVQVVLSRIDSRLADWFALLQGEVEQLRQQRQSLLGEVQQQKQQQQQLVSESLAGLVERCSEALQQKIAQVQPQKSEPLMLSLDSSLRTVFTTLEKDLQGYYDSLSQGLERMHGLGQQGEAKFLAYVRRLTQQIEQFPSPTQPAKEAELAAVMSDLSENTAIEEIDKIAALTDLIEQEPENEASFSEVEEENIPCDRGWYLAIDFGTEGLAAVLFDRQKEQVYPLAWISESGEFCDRLPTEVYYQSDPETQQFAFTFGPMAKAKAKDKVGIFLKNWQEKLLLDDFQSYAAQKALEALFSSLIPAGAESVNGLIVEALGLTSESFVQDLSQVVGAILGRPANWSELYQTRLREAVLQTQLVREAEQIFFLEEAIADLLAYLSLNAVAQTTVLVVRSSAIATELVLADIPEDYRALSRNNLSLESFAYGGTAMDQDILVQLLYPQWSDRLNPSIPRLDEELPQPGQPDLQKRENLSARLQSHPIGSSFLEAAKLTKNILQEQPEFTTRLGRSQWGVKRQDLVVKTIGPYLDRLREAIDSLLKRTGKSTDAIEQVVLSGGSTAAIAYALSPWIKQKLPNAAVIENAGAAPETLTAIGLACLPLYPLILERQ